ncbi:hypothetical protein HRbin23_01609 [bacterium HR23]|nr:hypothetical protein HRbin23_01609 [bacterium HR23]
MAHAIQIGQALLKVALVLLPLKHHAPLVALQNKGAGAHQALGAGEVPVALQGAGGGDLAPGAGNGGDEEGRSKLQGEAHRIIVHDLKLLHQRFQEAPTPRGGELGVPDTQHPLNTRLHIFGGESRAIVPHHVLPQIEGIHLPVGRLLPPLRQVGGDVEGVAGVVFDETAEYPDGDLQVAYNGGGVGVNLHRVGVVVVVQDAPLLGPFPHRGGRQDGRGARRDGGRSGYSRRWRRGSRWGDGRCGSGGRGRGARRRRSRRSRRRRPSAGHRQEHYYKSEYPYRLLHGQPPRTKIRSTRLHGCPSPIAHLSDRPCPPTRPGRA